jgi:hypothetical protein
VKNKRGISAMISSVLLILIIISAIGIIYTYVNKTTSKLTNLSPESCLDIQSGQEVSLKIVEYNEVLESTLVTILRKISSEKIDSFEITLLYEDGNSDSYSCGNCNNCEILKEGTQKEYLIPNKRKPIRVDLIVNQDCIMNSLNIK